MKKPILIDILEHGRFICQMVYDKRGFPQEIEGGKIVETHRLKDIEKFVYNKRPSLKGREIRIEFSNQKI